MSDLKSALQELALANHEREQQNLVVENQRKQYLLSLEETTRRLYVENQNLLVENQRLRSLPPETVEVPVEKEVRVPVPSYQKVGDYLILLFVLLFLGVLGAVVLFFYLPLQEAFLSCGALSFCLSILAAVLFRGLTE